VPHAARYKGGVTFIDITAVPVATHDRSAYLEFSRRVAEVYRDHGATRITDYWQIDGPTSQDDFHADGVEYAEGELLSFAALMRTLPSEAVVITVMEWPSAKVRAAGTAAATSDPRILATLDEDAVFDGSRVVATSFEVTMDLKA
jgi:uncharacterized protein YbaA (DUF1428 family)